jgi:drug/metabolite transporter (DMT)-like permease
LWSTNALVAKYLLAGHPVALVQFLQFVGASLVFMVIRLVGGAMPSTAPHEGFAPVAIGVVGLVGTMVLQYVAFASMPVIEANLIAYTWPLLVAAAMILSGKAEHPAALGITAVVGFFGATLVITGGAGSLSIGENVLGAAAAAGSALCMAFYTLAVGHYRTSPDQLLLPSALIGVVGTFLWCLRDQVTWTLDFDLVLALYLGAGPMGLGYYFWSRAMRCDPTAKVAIMGYLTPIASTALLLVFGERLTVAAGLGAAIVITSCIAARPGRQRVENHA